MTVARTPRKRERARTAAPSRPASALESAGVRPSKLRGQNFLTSGAIAARIVAAAEITPLDDVIEIGPGLGILTEKLAIGPRRSLTLVELDARLAARLENRFADDGVRIVNADFLSIDFAAVAKHPPVTVIGNLPFNAAAAILRRLCDNAKLISRMVLMFQREVAERIRARVGDDGYSALSVYTALYWEIDFHFVVAPGSFHPRPKVAAEVLRFIPRTNFPFTPDRERAVLRVIRASFSAPRKTVRNSLSHALGIPVAEISEALARASIDAAARAETLGVPDFVRLAEALGPALAGATVSHDA